MKVIFFNSCKKWGGGEKWHLEMAIGMQKMGVEVHAFANKKSLLYERFKENKIPVTAIGVTALSMLNAIKIMKLVKVLKPLNAQTIILNLPADVKFAGLAAKLAGIKNIVYRRGSAIPIKNSFVNRFIFKHIVSNVLANSQETKRTVLAKNSRLFDADKIKVIYNGIDPTKYDLSHNKEFPINKQQEVVFGNLARLSKQKGQFDLIAVAEELKKTDLNFKILIGGNGELEAELKAAVSEKGLDDCVLFKGFVEEVSAFYKSIDVFLFPSIWEGFGFTLVEAKLFKKPIVAYRVSSNPEVICDQKDGTLVPLGRIDLFVKAALEFASSRDKTLQFGEYGYKDVNERFLFEQSIGSLYQYLNKLSDL